MSDERNLPELPDSEQLGPFMRALAFNCKIGADKAWVDEWLDTKAVVRPDFWDAVLDITEAALERYNDGADLRGAVGAAIVQALIVGHGAAEGSVELP